MDYQEKGVSSVSGLVSAFTVMTRKHSQTLDQQALLGVLVPLCSVGLDQVANLDLPHLGCFHWVALLASRGRGLGKAWGVGREWRLSFRAWSPCS